MSDYETFKNDWIDSAGTEESPTLLFQFEHPKYGMYYVWYDGICYGIGKGPSPVHCGYASLAELFKWKGF